MPQAMCQYIVFGMACGTRKRDIGSGTGIVWKKSLFSGRVESYFAVYDSVVLTGPICRSLQAQDLNRLTLVREPKQESLSSPSC